MFWKDKITRVFQVPDVSIPEHIRGGWRYEGSWDEQGVRSGMLVWEEMCAFQSIFSDEEGERTFQVRNMWGMRCFSILEHIQGWGRCQDISGGSLNLSEEIPHRTCLGLPNLGRPHLHLRANSSKVQHCLVWLLSGFVVHFALVGTYYAWLVIHTTLVGGREGCLNYESGASQGCLTGSRARGFPWMACGI